MIKPFKILETRTEADGSIGVSFEVSKTTFDNGTEKTNSLISYASFDKDADIDAELYEHLKQGGWFE